MTSRQDLFMRSFTSCIYKYFMFAENAFLMNGQKQLNQMYLFNNSENPNWVKTHSVAMISRNQTTRMPYSSSSSVFLCPPLSVSQKIRMVISRELKELPKIRWCQNDTGFLRAFEVFKK